MPEKIVIINPERTGESPDVIMLMQHHNGSRLVQSLKELAGVFDNFEKGEDLILVVESINATPEVAAAIQAQVESQGFTSEVMIRGSFAIAGRFMEITHKLSEGVLKIDEIVQAGEVAKPLSGFYRSHESSYRKMARLGKAAVLGQWSQLERELGVLLNDGDYSPTMIYNVGVWSYVEAAAKKKGIRVSCIFESAEPDSIIINIRNLDRAAEAFEYCLNGFISHPYGSPGYVKMITEGYLRDYVGFQAYGQKERDNRIIELIRQETDKRPKAKVLGVFGSNHFMIGEGVAANNSIVGQVNRLATGDTIQAKFVRSMRSGRPLGTDLYQASAAFILEHIICNANEGLNPEIISEIKNGLLAGDAEKVIAIQGLARQLHQANNISRKQVEPVPDPIRQAVKEIIGF